MRFLIRLLFFPFWLHLGFSLLRRLPWWLHLAAAFYLGSYALTQHQEHLADQQQVQAQAAALAPPSRAYSDPLEANVWTGKQEVNFSAELPDFLPVFTVGDKVITKRAALVLSEPEAPVVLVLIAPPSQEDALRRYVAQNRSGAQLRVQGWLNPALVVRENLQLQMNFAGYNPAARLVLVEPFMKGRRAAFDERINRSDVVTWIFGLVAGLFFVTGMSKLLLWIRRLQMRSAPKGAAKPVRAARKRSSTRRAKRSATKAPDAPWGTRPEAAQETPEWGTHHPFADKDKHADAHADDRAVDKEVDDIVARAFGRAPRAK